MTEVSKKKLLLMIYRPFVLKTLISRWQISYFWTYFWTWYKFVLFFILRSRFHSRNVKSDISTYLSKHIIRMSMVWVDLPCVVRGDLSLSKYHKNVDGVQYTRFLTRRNLTKVLISRNILYSWTFSVLNKLFSPLRVRIRVKVQQDKNSPTLDFST